MTKTSALIGFVALLLLCCLGHSDASYALIIAPDEEECFVIRTPAEKVSAITGSFDCLDDDAEPKELSVSMTNFETGESLYEAPADALEGTFSIEKVEPSTRYALCFQNHYDDNDEENELDVGFNIRVATVPRSLEDEEIGPDAERALKLVQKAAAIHQDWSNLMDHLDFVRNREAIHDEMHDAILSRLSRWTYIEALLVIGMAIGQVLYWKKFFETKRYL